MSFLVSDLYEFTVQIDCVYACEFSASLRIPQGVCLFCFESRLVCYFDYYLKQKSNQSVLMNADHVVLRSSAQCVM